MQPGSSPTRNSLAHFKQVLNSSASRLFILYQISFFFFFMYSGNHIFTPLESNGNPCSRNTLCLILMECYLLDTFICYLVVYEAYP